MGNYTGIVTTGGLRSSALVGVAGVLLGDSVRATRDALVPIIHDTDLETWATHQATMLAALDLQPEAQAELAAFVHLFGGDTATLTIAECTSGWVTAQNIRELKNPPDEVVIVNGPAHEITKTLGLDELTLNSDVFLTSMDAPSVLQFGIHESSSRWPDRTSTSDIWYRQEALAGLIVEAMAAAWGVPVREVLEDSGILGLDSRAIGLGDGKEVTQPASVVRNPRAN